MKPPVHLGVGPVLHRDDLADKGVTERISGWREQLIEIGADRRS